MSFATEVRGTTVIRLGGPSDYGAPWHLFEGTRQERHAAIVEAFDLDPKVSDGLSLQQLRERVEAAARSAR